MHNIISRQNVASTVVPVSRCIYGFCIAHARSSSKWGVKKREIDVR